MDAINKTLDLGDLRRGTYASLVREIDSFIKVLSQRGVRFTTYQAEFDTGWGEGNIWFTRKLWEICTVIVQSELKPGIRILDCGGASTLFSFFLASKGFEVHTADIDWRSQGIIRNAEDAAAVMHWKMHNIKTDMAHLPYKDGHFDRVFSVCVLEHIPRHNALKAVVEMARVLAPGGIMGLTFDYGPDAYDEKYADVGELNERIVIPSGLRIRGNLDYQENPWFAERRGKTWGVLFLEKPMHGTVVEQPLLFCSRPQGRFIIGVILLARSLLKWVKDRLWSMGIHRRNPAYVFFRTMFHKP